MNNEFSYNYGDLYKNDRFVRMRYQIVKDLLSPYLNSELSNSIKSWQDEIGFIPLMSSEMIKTIWFSFDIIDNNSAIGSIVFVPFEANSVEEIKSDANFLMEAMRRKFMAENIEFKYEILIPDNSSVVLNFQINGLLSLWEKIVGDDFIDLGVTSSEVQINS